MKKLRYFIFCFAFAFYAAAGLLPTFQQKPETTIEVQEEVPYFEVIKED